MDHFAKLVICLGASCCSQIAFAAYSNLQPPPGFTYNAGQAMYNTAVATTTVGGQTATVLMPNINTNAIATVGGRAVKIPIAMRLQAAARSVAAAAIFMSPHLRTVASIASWLMLAKTAFNETTGLWEVSRPNVDQFIPPYRYTSGTGDWYNDYQDAVQVFINHLENTGKYSSVQCSAPSVNPTGDNWSTPILCTVKLKAYPYSVLQSNGVLTARKQGCPVGWQQTPEGCFSPNIKATPLKDVDEFVRELSPITMPDNVPANLPVPLPVDLPMINPGPDFVPAHRPVFIPTGDPVPNPDFDPSKEVVKPNLPWYQPGVRLVPSPTEIEPWRVDMQPVNIPQESDKPIQSPDFGGDGGGQRSEKALGLCDEYPDILACAKMGSLEPVKIPEKTITLEINKEGGFGPENGVCPAPKPFTVLGMTYYLDLDLICRFATGIRPLIIAFAWLSAVLSFLGLSRKGN